MNTTGRPGAASWWIRAGWATLAALHSHGRMLEHEWASLFGVALQARLLVRERLIHHPRPAAFRQVGANVPCGLWQSVQFMNPSFTRCLNGIENCARTLVWQP